MWSNRRFHTVSDQLEALWTAVRSAGDAQVTVVMEPTRNAWVPLAAWLRARGATVQLVPSEQSADLRKYYNKHAKTDRLDCELLARLPLLHPDGLRPTPGLGPGEALRRAVAHGRAWSLGAPLARSAWTGCSSCSARAGQRCWASSWARPRSPCSSATPIRMPCNDSVGPG